MALDARVQRRGLRRVAVALGAAVIIVASAPGTTANSGWQFSSFEQCMIEKINNARARHGLQRLQADKQLGYVARRHAGDMARSNSIWHNDVGSVVTRWKRLGQNVGYGSGCRRLFGYFMRSSKHRANILGTWRHVGVGAQSSGGRVFVQHVFEARLDPGNVYHYP